VSTPPKAKPKLKRKTTRAKTATPVQAETHPKFEALLARFAGEPALRSVVDTYEAGKQAKGRKFGANGLKVNRKLFALWVKGRLVLKLPKARVDGFVSAGQGERFDPGHGRLMKEWLVLVSPKLDWIALAKEAHDFVGATSA
jgi:hypothetical protein